MIGRTLRVCSVLVAAMVGAVGASGVVSPPPLTFDVAGRSNATPWVAAAGSFVTVAWGASGEGKSDVFLSVSRDAGRTFGSPVQVNAVPGEARVGGELPPRVVLVATRGAAIPEIVVLWTARGDATEIKTARSRDGGRTVDAPVTLQSPGAPGDRGWAAAAVDPQGALHAIWLDHRRQTPRKPSSPGVKHQHTGNHDGAAMAQKSGLFYASLAAKPTSDRELTPGVCYCCKTALAAGSDGTLYAAWRHVYPGNFRDMAFTMSRDGGRSFSPPARISEDNWPLNGCPDDGPAVVVSSDRAAHIVWPTVVSEPEPQGALFYSSTRDGRTFTPRVRIPTLGGPKPSHPQIVIDRRGRMFVAWDENVDGRRVASVRELKVKADRPPVFGDVITLTSDTPGMYPVVAATDRGLFAVWSTGGAPSRVEGRAIEIP